MKTKLKSSPSPAEKTVLQVAASDLQAAVSRRLAAQTTVADSQARLSELRTEEASIAERLKTANRENSRAMALELAAIRIEIDEANRQLTDATTQAESVPTELQAQMKKAGVAIESVCRDFPQQVKDRFVQATASFFTHKVTALQAVQQTDLFRAVSGFLASVTRDFSNPESAMDEAARRIEIMNRIESGEPAFEWESPSA